ncbi:hypothetical protein VS883_28865, partial [Escherichia coli]
PLTRCSADDIVYDNEQLAREKVLPIVERLRQAVDQWKPLTRCSADDIVYDNEQLAREKVLPIVERLRQA